jgi:outer membrane protein assembly factor BamB
MHTLRAFLPGLVLIAAAGGAPTDEKSFQPGPFDWPQWQGPERNASSRETGLLQDWPQGGPPLAWKAEKLGGGYSAPAVAAGRVVGMSYRGNDEVVWALDEATGKELWHTAIGSKVKISYNEGPRCTPAVDQGYVYALGVSGDLVCLDASTGKKVWARNLQREFGVEKLPQWGYSESPLVDGDLVLASPGGQNTIVAFQKQTGSTAWTARVPEKDEAHYSSIVAATIEGQKQYIQFLKRGIVGVSTEGKFLWRYDHPANKMANISTVVISGNDVLASSAYEAGAGMISVRKKGEGFEIREMYFTKSLRNHHGGMILHDGLVYGANGGNSDQSHEALACLDFKSGKVLWQNHNEAGKGALAYADERLYYRTERGDMLLVEPNPRGYVEHGRFEQPNRSDMKAWSHPVIANGRLYLRDQGLLLVYDIKKK